MKVSNNRLYWIINFFIFFLIIYFCSTSIYAEEETPLEEINNYEIIEVLDDETNISADSNEEIILNNEDESHGNDSLIESGWKTDENGNLLFLDENGVPIQGWFQTDGFSYYANESGIIQKYQWVDGHFLDENGRMVTNSTYNVNEKLYYFDANGNVKKGWILTNEGWYYANSDGSLYKGWLKLDAWYYFNDNGLMAQNAKLIINGSTYLFDENGRMKTGWVQRSEGWYYVNGSGAMTTGWIKTNAWYYLDGKNEENPGLMACDEKKEIDSKTYFFNNSGAMLTGWVKRPEGWYYTNGSGAMTTGWIKTNAWYYLDGKNEENPGLMACDEKKEIDSKTYFFNNSGAMLTGWVKRPEGWYYTNGSGAMITGWVKTNAWYYLDGKNEENRGLMVCDEKKEIDSKSYFFDESGAMLTGWIQSNDLTYYALSNGSLAKNWNTISNKKYYFDEDNTLFKGETIALNEKEYYFNEDHSLKTGWIISNNEKYYLDDNGLKTSGWKKINGYWYYMDPVTFYMVHDGFHEVDSQKYYFNSNGIMHTNWLKLLTDWYFFGSDGAMKTGTATYGSDAYYLYKLNDENGGSEGVMAYSCVIKNFKTELYLGSSGAVYKTVVNGVPYYSQKDPKWANTYIGSYTMQQSGCVPTTATMIINYYLDTDYLPTEIAQLLYENGYMNPDRNSIGSSGQSWRCISNNYGLNFINNLSYNSLLAQIKSGKMIATAVGAGTFTIPGYTHEILMFGYDNGYVTIYDPYNTSKCGKYLFDDIWNQRSTHPYDKIDGGPFFSI